MTRRSITTVLGSLLVGLLLTINVPAVSAEGGCDPADAGTVDQCVTLAAQAHVSIASTDSHILCTHPVVGFPTCYTLQADGTWMREELPDTDSTWVMVGLVAFDEVVAAVGDVNVIVP